MKVPRERISRLGAEALPVPAESALTDKQKFLLTECVEAYLPTDEALRREFEPVPAAEPYQAVRAVNKAGRESGTEERI